MKSRTNLARRITALLSGLTLLSLTACSALSQEEEGGSGQIRVAATGVDSLPFMAVLQLAVDKGWFEREELNVSILSGGGGGNTLRTVTSGDADLAITGSPAVVHAAQTPAANLTVIGSWMQVNDFSWITPDQGASLEGASLGFSKAGSATELIVNGVKEELADKRLTSISVGEMGDNWVAAKAGRITAGWAMHPFVTEKQEEEGAKVLLSARDVIGDHPADLVAVNNDFKEANGKQLSAFFRVVDKAFNYVVREPEKAAKDLGPLVDVTPEIMATALRQTPELETAYSLKVDPQALRNLSDLMVGAGEIDEPIEWGSLLDQRYLPENARADLDGKEG
ncbi:NitT/TauT family transport system substrate-binding protein [Tamaricihabitans halophyticus]|uniref:NitT/TauT family transport system substrate-binding protein n=1 Tax=Tamaricihabitans halophyticus TaxID=1262583 RepID=A0A4R2R6R4_9PSEU|nr:ABC transporter substrate-binding protein [Tamaricihabitans halophyticus]TCP55321.1 NitT/TauT family transport system substrate-binding protein [Tamaricihabitans halophyticus]